MVRLEVVDSGRIFEAESKELRPPLQSGGGGSTFDGMEALIDAKVAAAEARTDTKFAEVLGELKAIKASTSGLKTTVILTGIGAIAVVVAIIAYGGSMFGTGLSVDTIAQHAAERV